MDSAERGTGRERETWLKEMKWMGPRAKDLQEKKNNREDTKEIYSNVSQRTLADCFYFPFESF